MFPAKVVSLVFWYRPFKINGLSDTRPIPMVSMRFYPIPSATEDGIGYVTDYKG
jgi:hypothetical protein